jgi:hypothetical protein
MHNGNRNGSPRCWTWAARLVGWKAQVDIGWNDPQSNGVSPNRFSLFSLYFRKFYREQGLTANVFLKNLVEIVEDFHQIQVATASRRDPIIASDNG